MAREEDGRQKEEGGGKEGETQPKWYLLRPFREEKEAAVEKFLLPSL